MTVIVGEKIIIVMKIISFVMIKKLCVGLRAVNKKKKKKKLSPYLKYKYKNPRVEGEYSDFSSQLVHFSPSTSSSSS